MRCVRANYIKRVWNWVKRRALVNIDEALGCLKFEFNKQLMTTSLKKKSPQSLFVT
jgi:hypothetical protein